MTIAQLLTDNNTNIAAKIAADSISPTIDGAERAKLINELLERGVRTVADTTAMSAVSGADYKQVLVENNGFYKWLVGGTANGTTIFAAAGGGTWNRTLSVAGGAYSSSIAFTENIPFDYPVTVMDKLITADLVFTANTVGAVAGNGCTLRLVSNGINVPDLSAFKKLSTSDDFSNTTGTVHDITFYYNGVDYVYTIAISHVIDIGAPLIVSRTVEADFPNKIILTANELLDEASVPATTAFALSGGKTATLVEVDGDTITVTADSDYDDTDSITIGYTAPGSNMIKDLFGNNLASFAPAIVENNISTILGTDITLFAKDALLTQAGTEYISDAAAYIRVSGVSNESHAADGELIVDIPSAADAFAPEFGFKTAQTVGNYTTWNNGLVKQYNQFYPIEAGGLGTLISTVIVNDDKIILRRTGTVAEAFLLRGGVESSLYVFTTPVPAGPIYFGITAIDDGTYVGKVVNPRYL